MKTSWNAWKFDENLECVFCYTLQFNHDLVKSTFHLIVSSQGSVADISSRILVVLLVFRQYVCDRDRCFLLLKFLWMESASSSMHLKFILLMFIFRLKLTSYRSVRGPVTQVILTTTKKNLCAYLQPRSVQKSSVTFEHGRAPQPSTSK